MVLQTDGIALLQSRQGSDTILTETPFTTLSTWSLKLPSTKC